MGRPARLWNRLFAILSIAAYPMSSAGQYGAPAPSTPQPDMPQNRPTPNAPATAPTVAPTSGTELLRAAACVAGRNGEAVNALIATSPFSADERDRAVRVLRAAERCLRLDTPLATSAMMFRGALAESLYESQFAQAPAARTPAAASAPFFRPAEIAGRDNAALLTAHFDVAQCAVPRNPELVRAVLAAQPGSEAELAALTALFPVFGACRPSGSPQLRMDRGAIRAILAESLYRWSVVQRDGPSSAWAAPAAAAPAAPARPGG